MSLGDFKFLVLRAETEIPAFRSKDSDLNDFLLNDAKKFLAELLAVTYLFVDTESNRTVAYFSLLNDKVAFDPDERHLWNRINRNISNRKRRKSYPSVKIGRLAVSKEYEGTGVGSAILDLVKRRFISGNRTGCRFIAVDAYAEATEFYRKNGFDFLTEKDKNDETRLMFFDLKPFRDGTIAAMKSRTCA